MNINSTSSNLGLANTANSTASKISSGKQVNNAADSPAAIQIIQQFNSQISGNSVAHSNVINGTSAVQIAQSGLSQVNDSLQQLRELGIQAGNGALNEDNRNAIQKQADELLLGIKDTIKNSSFNNRSLLNSDEAVSIQTGANQGQTQDLPSVNLESAFNSSGLFDIDFSAANISNTLNSIDQALDINSSASSHFASAQKGLDISAKTLNSASVNQAQSRSQIEDTDFAAAISELKKQQLSEEVELVMLSQANANRSQVLQLLKT